MERECIERKGTEVTNREKGNGSDREWDRREGTDVTKGNRR